jgi:hypothetical protein
MSGMRFPHWPPKSLAEALEWRSARVELKRDLSNQMGRKNATDETGARMDSHRYHEWRDRARHALTAVDGELGLLSAWVREQRQTVHAELASRDRSVNPHDVSSLVRAALCVLKKMRADGVEFDPEDTAVQDALSEWLMHERPTVVAQ